MQRFVEGGVAHLADSLAATYEIAKRRGWPVAPGVRESISVEARGIWRTYAMEVTEHGDDPSIRVSAGFRLSVPERRLAAVIDTMEVVNDTLSHGAFHFRRPASRVLFRVAVPIALLQSPASLIVDSLIDHAIGCCDAAYPALQTAASTDQSAETAVRAAMLRPVGSA